MNNVFLGTSYEGKPTGELKKRQVRSFKEFCDKFLSTCIQGKKHDYYVTIGDNYVVTPADPEAPGMSYKSKDHFHRNDVSQTSAWLLPFDGDNSKTYEGSCIDPEKVHRSLKKLNYNHAIYTTHSHKSGDKIRWRLFIPCKMTKKSQLGPSVSYLFKQLSANGCKDLAMSTESKTWSNPWFLPTRDDPEDGEFQFFEFHEGKDFIPVDGIEYKDGIQVEANTEESRTMQEMLKTIHEGRADSGLHKATRDLSYGLIRDGLAPGAVKSILYFLMRDYNPADARQAENLGKVESVVDSAVKKVLEEVPETDEWYLPTLADENRIYTDYPEQGGVMQDIIEYCLKWMPYPNKQIATIAAHALISTLGGRVYTLESGSGIVLTALVTGRSTIGKSFIKKFCIHVLNSFQIAHTAQDFLGSHFYTSSKNLIAELEKTGSLLSVRTESGQSDKSNAGDMTRVLMYELELATESGKNGYVSSGGQNDKIPPLFSPAVTTIRESVAQIQNEADIIRATSVSGVAGRRSHVLIDPIKAPFNEYPEQKLPKPIKLLVTELYKLAANEQRRKVTEPMAADLWKIIPFKNPQYLAKKRAEWVNKENKAAMTLSHMESTFYGRLGERLPSWAARLAICDNYENPVITNQHVDIAEASLMAEVHANLSQQNSGELDSDIHQTANFIIDMFRGDMTQNKSLCNDRNKKMLKDGACELHRIMNRARMRSSYKCGAVRIPNIDNILLQTIKTRGLIELSKEEAIEKYKYRGRVLKRV